MVNREFTVASAYTYNRAGPIRWIISHVLRYKVYLLIFAVGTILAQVLTAVVPVLTGNAFSIVLSPHPSASALITITLEIVGIVAALFVVAPAGVFGSEILAQRLERDARDELYLSLLAKSQTYHNQQRVGDIMARATNDVRQLNPMINPGVSLILDSMSSLFIPIIFIGFINPQLLLAPLLFTVGFFFAVWRYTRQLTPVTANMRAQFGEMNAELEETITGIEVVKSTAQEQQEEGKFARNASKYRDFFVKNGAIQARYIPPLLIAIAFVIAFLHGVFLIAQHQLSIGGLIAYMGLMTLLRYPSFISIFTFSLVQLGVAGANRILNVMRQETELDENANGYDEPMRGEIAFEDVSFSYKGIPNIAEGDEPDNTPTSQLGQSEPTFALADITLRIPAGQTVAIVGQTGAGKTTLTRLVNRTYDATSGRVLIDGVDVRDWSLDGLRSQIGAIEQDIFLFSRTIAENIAFGVGAPLGDSSEPAVSREAIEQAAKQAQAHDFIMSFANGYDTVVGERGVTLSGGQRQRLAIARALLTNPRILILDDATSAIDSATEDEIQRALHEVMEGRTTLLITNRLSQIRRADQVVLLRQGRMVAVGSHDELMASSDLYRRIFIRYDGDEKNSKLMQAVAEAMTSANDQADERDHQTVAACG